MTPLRNRFTIAAGAAALLAGLVYLNALRNPFVYDDYRTVVANSSLEHLSNLHAIVLHDVARPVVNFSYAIDRALWGRGPVGFHATSVLLHMLNVVLLFLLAVRLSGGRVIVAFGAAALFAVHPVMTEAVGYVSGRSEVLCATWFLAALLCGRRWLKGDGWRWSVLTILFWIAALATKETAAMLPFVLSAYDRFLGSGSPGEKRRRMVAIHLPLMGVSFIAGALRLAVLLVEYPVTIHWSYALIAVDVVGRYVAMLVNPVGQAMFHEVAGFHSIFELRAIVAIGIVAALIGLSWMLRRRDALAGFGVAWFLLLLLPSSVLIVFDQGEPMTEHRVYLASAGLFLTLGAAAGQLETWSARVGGWRRLLAPAVLTVLTVSFGLETVVRNRVWSSPLTLWDESVNLAPNHFRPRLLLGEALQDAGRREEAIEQYRTALRLRPTEPSAYIKLGECLIEMGRLDEAAAAFERLRTVDAQSAQASTGLGTAAVLAGRTDRARQYFQEAIAQDPRNVSARRSLALLAELGTNPAEALRLCEEIQRIAPATPGNDDCVRRNRASLSSASK